MICLPLLESTEVYSLHQLLELSLSEWTRATEGERKERGERKQVEMYAEECNEEKIMVQKSK